MTDDIGTEVAVEPAASDLRRATIMGELLVHQAQLVAVLEEDLKNAKANLLKTAREDLPELMKELGLIQFKLKTGEQIEVKEDLSCGITESRKQEAMRWLNGHGFGGLIKTLVSVEFGRGEIDTAEELALRLQAEGLPAIADEDVHPSTLKSFIKGELEAGRTVPYDLFGVFPYSFAKATAPSKRK